MNSNDLLRILYKSVFLDFSYVSGTSFIRIKQKVRYPLHDLCSSAEEVTFKSSGV